MGFLGGGGRPAESSARVLGPSSPNIVQAGSVIPAALITGIQSDLPGQITAQVTQNVYDSPTGRILLIPQGARLVGEYDSEIAGGQNRVLLAWDRLIFPGGRSIALDRLPGGDGSGMAGLADRTFYKQRNRIERVFGHLKINRASATRYDQLANSFLDGPHRHRQMLAQICPRRLAATLPNPLRRHHEARLPKADTAVRSKRLPHAICEQFQRPSTGSRSVP